MYILSFIHYFNVGLVAYFCFFNGYILLKIFVTSNSLFKLFYVNENTISNQEPFTGLLDIMYE